MTWRWGKLKVTNDLGKFRKAVIWKNELPSIPIKLGQELEITLELSRPIVSEDKKLALELKLPRNSSYYALLGIEFIANQTSKLIIKTVIGDSSNSMFHSELEQGKENIYSGIPAEYAEIILNSAKEIAIESKWLYSGRITFACGAHSVVGSSEAIFSKVTKVLMVLLQNELTADTFLSDDSVILLEMDK
ncbi:hypothetical protein [Paenibacillus sp. FSL H8-0332]|uniref:hypothetical protein n=1 Tax=Paenibacillus sp. FSL H8-0332 TaxID=2954742 RepID=UPI0030D2B919